MDQASSAAEVGQMWLNHLDFEADEMLIKLLSGNSKQKAIKAGTTLIEQFDTADCVYLVIEGVLKAVVYTEQGHEIWMSDAHPGELIGEIAILERTLRTSNVVAVSDVRLLRLPRETFLEALEAYGEFALMIARLLARRLHGTSAQLSQVAAVPVTARLYAELERTADVVFERSDLKHIAMPPTVSELARRIHATREATSRAMTQLEKRGLVQRLDDSWNVILTNA